MAVKMTLRHLKRNPAKRERFIGRKVRIWSGEWRAWWRPEASGYTDDIAQAGVYSFDDAWARSHNCCPGKKISFVAVIPPALRLPSREEDFIADKYGDWRE